MAPRYHQLPPRQGRIARFSRDERLNLIGLVWILHIPPISYALLANEPADEPPDAQSSSTGSALTAAQRAAWDKWAEKEAKARSTLILTVSDGIAAEVENLWSSAEIYTHITAEHKVDTYQRRGDLMARIHMLSLPEAASRETMIDHYERFITPHIGIHRRWDSHRGLGEVREVPPVPFARSRPPQVPNSSFSRPTDAPGENWFRSTSLWPTAAVSKPIAKLP